MEAANKLESKSLCGKKMTIALILSLALAPAFSANAQSELDLRYGASQSVDPPPDSIPVADGESLSLERGVLELKVTDIALKGNNDLPVELSRRFDTNVLTQRQQRGPLGNWELALPQITVVHPKIHGWRTSDPARPYKNCSVASGALAPPSRAAAGDESKFEPLSYWTPPTVRGVNDEGMLIYRDVAGDEPRGGAKHYWRTSGLAFASCLDTLVNAGTAYPTNEGYLLRTPEGFSYYFNWIATKSSVRSYTTYVPVGAPSGTIYSAYMDLVTIAIYPTRIEDRNGNWVSFSYSNSSDQPVKLNGITSSDGRSIQLSYDDRGYLVAATTNSRTWRYEFDNSPTYRSLISVTNPDGSAWKYSGNPLTRLMPFDPYRGSCITTDVWSAPRDSDTIDIEPSNTTSYNVQTPTGASIEYKFAPTILGRSGVPKSCYVTSWISTPFFGFVQEPAIAVFERQISLVRKTMTGPGISPLVWKYGYLGRIGWLPFKDGFTRTRIVNPDGSLEVYQYGNTYKHNEGLLLRHEKSDNFTSSITTYSYELGQTNSQFPKRIGMSPMLVDDGYASTHLRPLIRRATVIRGSTFQWDVPANCNGATCLDSYGRPTQVVKSSW